MEDRLAEQLVISPPNRGVNRLSVAAPETFNWPAAMLAAFEKPMGARFYRCALQVNTPRQNRFKGFDSKHAKHSAAYQREYGLALAKVCKKNAIDAVGICDHNSIEYLDAVRRQLNEENIFVFPGFEVASTEGLHILCLFDLDTSSQELDHILTELGVSLKERWATKVGDAPRQSERKFLDIIEHVQSKRRGICIAAHMDRENGLLFECAKTTRAQYFGDPRLLAGQISGGRNDLSNFHRKVLDNELRHYHRTRPLALVNCLDVYNLKDLGLPASSTLIKMSAPSIEGLRQAFLDPESRLRLQTDLHKQAPSETGLENFKLVAMCWNGGFLDGCGVRFNENLNCLIGGRGAGKSTIIESLRYVLDQQPLVQKSYEKLLKQVIKSGTTISLLVYAQNPTPGYYRIERAYIEKPEAPVIFDENGERRSLKVFDLFSRIDIFGQHEIAGIAQQTDRQLALLHRFRTEDAQKWQVQKEESHLQLAQNRVELLEVLERKHALEEQLSRLPRLEEKLRQFRDSGAEQKLREQSLLAREEQILLSRRERVQQFRTALAQWRRVFENYEEEVSDYDDLPNRDLCERMEAVEKRLRKEWQEIAAAGEAACQRAQRDLLVLAQEWETRKRGRQEEYQKILRELQKDAVDGVAYVNLRNEIERLEPLRLQLHQLNQKHRDLEKKRKRLLQKWQEAKTQLFQVDEIAAAHVSRLLADKVQVTVTPEAERRPLQEKLKAIPELKNLADRIFERLQASSFRLQEFIEHLRGDPEALKENYEFTPKQVQALQQLNKGAVLEFEELDLPHRVHIALNIAEPNKKPNWRPLDEISIGQKATAILLMLLPESGAPLIIDQPEDDLDNRFIAETIIPKLREEKQKRQFLFATHNANIPVLGDAEQIIGLEAGNEGAMAKARVHPNSVGAIDCAPVKELVEHVLEGGQRAFETRRAKYGF